MQLGVVERSRLLKVGTGSRPLAAEGSDGSQHMMGGEEEHRLLGALGEGETLLHSRARINVCSTSGLP
jgi:hypothetical protein